MHEKTYKIADTKEKGWKQCEVLLGNCKGMCIGVCMCLCVCVSMYVLYSAPEGPCAMRNYINVRLAS